MSAHNIRFGSVIAFDEESELDIIKFLEGLNSSHKMGQFIAALIRTAVDNPELIKKTENGLQLTSLMNQLEANLVSSSRDVFFSYVKEELRRMVDKVNSVYDIAFKTYTLAQMNKALGLEQQSENNLLACFVLEKQLSDLQQKLGTESLVSVYNSDKKLANTKAKSDEVLEYIIETHSGVVNELKNLQNNLAQLVSNMSQVGAIAVNSNAGQQIDGVQQINAGQQIDGVQQINAGQKIDGVQQINAGQQVVNNTAQMSDTDYQIEDDINEEIDFGNADMEALANFFND